MQTRMMKRLCEERILFVLSKKRKQNWTGGLLKACLLDFSPFSINSQGLSYTLFHCKTIINDWWMQWQTYQFWGVFSSDKPELAEYAECCSFYFMHSQRLCWAFPIPSTKRQISTPLWFCHILRFKSLNETNWWITHCLIMQQARCRMRYMFWKHLQILVWNPIH